MALRLLDAEGLTATSQGRSGVRIRHPDPSGSPVHWCSCSPSPARRVGDLLDFRAMSRTRRRGPRRRARHPRHDASESPLSPSAVRHPTAPVITNSTSCCVQASENRFLTTILAAIEQAVRWAAAEQDISQYDREEATKSHHRQSLPPLLPKIRRRQRRMEQHLKAALRARRSIGTTWCADDSAVTMRVARTAICPGAEALLPFPSPAPATFERQPPRSRGDQRMDRIGAP